MSFYEVFQTFKHIHAQTHTKRRSLSLIARVYECLKDRELIEKKTMAATMKKKNKKKIDREFKEQHEN